MPLNAKQTNKLPQTFSCTIPFECVLQVVVPLEETDELFAALNEEPVESQKAPTTEASVNCVTQKLNSFMSLTNFLKRKKSPNCFIVLYNYMSVAGHLIEISTLIARIIDLFIWRLGEFSISGAYQGFRGLAPQISAKREFLHSQ